MNRRSFLRGIVAALTVAPVIRELIFAKAIVPVETPMTATQAMIDLEREDQLSYAEAKHAQAVKFWVDMCEHQEQQMWGGSNFGFKPS